MQKTVNGVVTNYTLHGKNVVHMTQGSNELHFFYDAANKPAVVVYNGTAYAYVKNLQGDIVGILDNAGNWVVEYTYDAWGAPTSRTGSMVDTLGKINPFRYRGYVYDQETGLYYISMRFYSSQTSRWVNADNRLAGIGEGTIGNNTFIYCMNNPVCMEDNSGKWPRWITAIVAVGAAVVASVFTAPAAPVVAIVATGTYIVQTLHYDTRQAGNIDLPASPEQAVELGWLGPDTIPQGPSAACHQYTARDGENTKYVSPDGHREVIYNAKGEMVTDPRDIGTYNVCPSGGPIQNVGHFCVDILPWVIFGNADDDPGPVVNTVVSWFD